jgi:hypothetical protein
MRSFKIFWFLPVASAQSTGNWTEQQPQTNSMATSLRWLPHLPGSLTVMSKPPTC